MIRDTILAIFVTMFITIILVQNCAIRELQLHIEQQRNSSLIITPVITGEKE